MATIVLLTAIAVIVGGLGFFVEVPSTTPYSPLNAGPGGYSVIVNAIDAELLTGPGGFNGSLILPLTHELSEEEMRWLSGFVVSGGRLIILDEGGYSNAFLTDYLNLSLYIVPIPIYDYVLNYEGNASLALINASLGNTSLTCYFELPSSVFLGGPPAAVIANSSSLSFRDVDGDGYFSLGDQFGPFPVVVELGLGEGSLFIITDLDAFTNAFIGLGNNSDLLSYVVGGGVAGFYLGGLNISLIDYVKLYAPSISVLGRGVAELGSLMIVALVIIYGRRSGVLA